MRPIWWVLSIVVAALVPGCSSGPVKRINPPSASIQELAIQTDGTWRLTLRVQNFSTVPMTFSQLRSSVAVDGTDVGNIQVDPAIEIVGENADVVIATLRTSAKLGIGRNVAYTLKGRIEASAPKAQGFDFEYSSRLSPVPGIPNTWR